MRESICTIPVSEAFETNDGCALCRMRDTIDARIVEYIMGAAMMEPDVRIETNELGFCGNHYKKMLSTRGRLQLAVMLESHIDEVKKNIFGKKLFTSSAKKNEKIKRLSDSCFICEKVEWGFSRMIETIYRTYEENMDFRGMFNGQSFFCMPHYELLISGVDRKKMKSYGGEMVSNLTRITGDCVNQLCDNISKYCKMYDYRNNTENKDWEDSRYSVESVISFLSGEKIGG